MSEPTEPIELNETQRATLRAVCDTVVPRVGGRDEFWARTASDIGVIRSTTHTGLSCCTARVPAATPP